MNGRGDSFGFFDLVASLVRSFFGSTLSSGESKYIQSCHSVLGGEFLKSI